MHKQASLYCVASVRHRELKGGTREGMNKATGEGNRLSLLRVNMSLALIINPSVYSSKVTMDKTQVILLFFVSQRHHLCLFSTF